MSETITPIRLEALESYLWGAAVLLRGSIDATSYKEYIFPLLFFKRVSDVWDEEHAASMDKFGEDFPEDHVVRIPDGAHWIDVRNVTENVGQALVAAFKHIEEANPPQRFDNREVGGLTGIFGASKLWTNKDTMPDELLTRLIEHFSEQNLSLAACPADEMGTAYEYLIGKFADDAGHTAQEFYTNRTVVELMARILKPQSHDSIYDPTCGSGGMLIKCLTSLKEQGKEWRDVKVYGQELNAITSSIARMNLMLHGMEDFSIINADTLTNPAFLKAGKLQQFDIVLANPPYSIKQWNRDMFANDPFGRNIWGTPPQGRADYAFIQHIICSLDDNNGRCAILLPHGVLNRTEEQDIRRRIVESDYVEAVIGLGRHLFYNSGLESCILVCRKNKAKDRKRKILFIEAEKHIHKKGTFTFLSPEDIQIIANAYDSNESVPGLSSLVPLEEVLKNDGNLNIKLYVKTLIQEQASDSNLSSSLQGYLNASSKFKALISELDLGVQICDREDSIVNSISFDDSLWEEVALGDVATEYSERCDNPSQSEYQCFIGSDCIGQYDFRIKKSSSTAGITSAQKVFAPGDYLLVRRSLYGSDFRERAPRADFRGVCSADILTIREIPEKTYSGFLIYVLYSQRLWNFIVSNSTGSLTRRIKWSQLKDFRFKLPPLGVQKKIADLLWVAYDLKESYKHLLASSDELAKSRFVEMFVGRFNEVKIGDWIKTTSGGTPSSKCSEYYNNGTIPWLTSGEVNHGIILKTQSFITQKGLENSSAKWIPANCVIIAMYGATAGKVGITGIPLTTNQAVCALLPADDFNEVYLLYACRNKEKWILANRSGAAQPNISQTIIKEMTIPKPPLSLQKHFASFIEQLDKSKVALQKSIERLDSLIKTLLQEH